ncbi:MAG TPA: hypothetical protein VFS67_03065 [Polyangiaceae bacterium]|nr:hypothetical protein [Polyangiaceae bacterium]
MRPPSSQRDSRSLTPVPRSATPFRPRNFAASSATSSSPASGEPLALAVVSKPHVPSLEQLTEARLARMKDENFLWETPPPAAHQMVLAQPAAEASALVPLQWRGLPLSEEFQQYALRVARGENLAPYRGPVLADGSEQLPWNERDARALRRKTRRGGGILLALAACLGMAAFVLPNLNQPEPYRVAEVQSFELQPKPPALTPTEQALAAAAAALEPAAPPAAVEPLPALRLPPKPAAARAPAPVANPAPSAPLASAAASAPRRAPVSTVATAPVTPPAASAATAAAVSAALKAPEPTAVHEAKSAAPAEPAADTTEMLLDKPSF